MDRDVGVYGICALQLLANRCPENRRSWTSAVVLAPVPTTLELPQIYQNFPLKVHSAQGMMCN